MVGDEGLRRSPSSADIVVNAVARLRRAPGHARAPWRPGKRLALANKESLIAAAPLVAHGARHAGRELLPIDSEHCAIHQCLAELTGRAGLPRRAAPARSPRRADPFGAGAMEQLEGGDARTTRCSHPTWTMGAKITIDSSTLMNKGLEVLEASALFGIDVERVDVVVHPQSIVHSMVEYVDGSVLAQLSRPDMRLPIAYCLGLPERLAHHGYGATRLHRGAGADLRAARPRGLPGAARSPTRRRDSAAPRRRG